MTSPINKMIECSVVTGGLLYLTLQQERIVALIATGTTASYGVLYHILRSSHLLQPAKSSLSHANEAEWRSRILATINAIVLVGGSVLCFLEWPYQPTSEGWIGQPDHIWSHPSLFSSLFVGYLHWDLIWLVWHRREQTDLSAVIHHVLFISVTHYVLSGTYFKRPFAWLSFTEVSTPFLNFRWFYAASNVKEGRGYFLSSLLFAITFLLTRVCGYGLGILDMLWSYGEWKENRGLHLVAVGLGMGYVLNLFWSVKVVHALQRAFKRDMPKIKRK
mmetsp:Transcript_1736/g.5072  ORF Transcript_1736/g.5072 Transcript_1736/m.5072 type:complete len:275 (-) Transcript_1736:35-859(-)